MEMERGELIVYQSENGQASVDVRLDNETVWLSQAQMEDLFGRERSVITKHINNIFKEGELVKNQVCAKFAHTAKDGKQYQVNSYNLDVIISVGYRVKSKNGTRFRIWATSVLREYLVKGVTLNKKRLAEKGLLEVKQTLALLTNTLEMQDLVSGEGAAVLQIVNAYARTWELLWKYDEDSLTVPRSRNNSGEMLTHQQVRLAITTMKKELLSKGEATDIFGQERGGGLAGVLGAVSQTFGGQDLYSTVEEKGANLLYFIIKDHPFVDGNKRIGSFLFLLFLQCNNKELQLDHRAMVALTLLAATSEPNQKDLVVRLIVNLLAQQ